MEENTKHIKVNREDWQELNLYLSLLQVQRLERLSFADVIHEIVEKFVKPEIARMQKG